jgi:signal transduction histidine kinase
MSDAASSTTRASTRLLTLPTLMAIVVTEAAGVAEAWARGGSAALVLASVAAAALAAGAVAAFDWHRVSAARALSFALLPVGIALMRLSSATVLVGLFPILCAAEIAWPIVGSGVTAAVFVPAMVWMGVEVHAAPTEILARCGGFVGGATFAVAFTRVAVAERRARAEFEKLLHANEEANERLREYAAMAGALSAAEERNRIARDIHDGVAHGLTVIHVQLEAARAVSGDDARALEVRACVDRAQQAAKEALADVRRSVGRLRDETARPLADDLRALVDECRASGVDAELSVEGTPCVLARATELVLRRATQEALTNVRRHAKARSVSVRLGYSEAAVTLSVCDDGRGAASPGQGFGLTGMRERVELLGGRFDVRTSPGAGFAIEIRLSA